MKKYLIAIALIFLGSWSHGQIDPAGGGQGTNSIEYWSRSGNNQNGSNNNIFGTKWNSPIYTVTGGISPTELRAKLNGIYNGTSSPQYSINGFGWLDNVNTTGYMLLGTNLNVGGNPIYTSKGAYSQLHLNGSTGTFVQEFGYRTWMKTGITFTDNNDLSYMGLRQVGTELDATETVISWSDNTGVDDFTLRFTNSNGNNTINSSDLVTTNDLDGLHVARFTGTGNFGLGNTFGINPTGTPANLYVTPQSLAHYSQSNSRSVWQQYTNRMGATPGTGTGEAAEDGLRMGIIGSTTANVNGTAAIYNQEERHLLFSTNANTNLMNVVTGATLERVRVTSIGAPTNLAAGGIGLNNPAGLGTNLTRVAITHNPAQPITRPMTLLHLGYNVGANSTVTSTDGWRSWMDIGTFTSNGTDHMYFGLKNEGSTERQDAVVNWGDNQTTGGPDNLRFIFTSAPTGGTAPATSANGLEGVRMTPTSATGVFTGIGGDPSSNLYGPAGNSINPTNTLEVNSWGATTTPGGSSGLRFTNLQSTTPLIANPGTGVLSVNANGDVIYVEGGATGPAGPAGPAGPTGATGPMGPAGATIGAHNGTSMSTLTANQVAFGQNLSQVGNPAMLLNHRQVPMNSNNILFSGHGRIGLGETFTNTTQIPQAKLDIRPTATDELGLAVYNNNPMPAFPIYNMNGMINNATGTSENVSLYISTGGDPVKRAVGIDCYARSSTTGMNLGMSSIGENGALANVGGMFGGRGNALRNAGISTNGHEATLTNIGGEFRAGNPDYLMGITNTGVFAQSFGGDYSYGIYAKAFSGNISTYAGYFDGDVFFNGNVYGSQFGWSDQNLKTDINNIPDGLGIIAQLTPRSYYYDTLNTSNLDLPSAKQYGFIAQEVETFLPEMVQTVIKPAEFDSLMNETSPSTTFKTLNYNGFIALLTQGIQEQSLIIDSLKTSNDSLKNVVGDLNNRLTQLENCLSGILPSLCQMNNSIVKENPAAIQEQLRTAIQVQLSDKNTIVLDQNVPNPFAESTVISYSIPANVGKAQIHFYDAAGKLIQSVELAERGAGQLNVFGNGLSKGIYTYSLVADGQVVSTKRMVKE